MKTTILVAAHKPYAMPQDAVYLPVQVGAAGKESLGWQRDDEGKHISGKNATFCEMTGHYWMWQNLDADVYGLCHYRRYFAARRPFQKKQKRILSARAIGRMMEKCDLVLPKKRHYWIETNYSQYIHAHHAEDLRLTRAILAEKAPAYLPAWEHQMQKRSGHRFNMFIMKKELFDGYSTWIFDILFELEKRLDISAYSPQDQRVFGYVAERLMDVWVETNAIPFRECPVVNLESQHWPKKILHFLQRKFHRPQSQSLDA